MDVNAVIPRRDLTCLLPSWRRAGRLRFEDSGFRLLPGPSGDVFVPWSDVQSVQLVFVHRGFRFVPAVEVVSTALAEPLVITFPGWLRRYPPHAAVDAAAAIRAAASQRSSATR